MHHIYQIIQQARVRLCNEQQLHALVFSQVPYLPILSSLSNKKEHLHHTVIMELSRKNTIGFIDCCTMDSQSTLVGKIRTPTRTC